MEYLSYISTFLFIVQIVLFGFAIYYTEASYKLADKIITDQDGIIKELFNSLTDYQEALSRNRQMLASYKEENSRCWRAVEVWEANYRELERLYREDTKKEPLIL